MKIAVVGLGKVGSAIVFGLIIRNLADHIVIYDENEKTLTGEWHDLMECARVLNSNTKIEIRHRDRNLDHLIITAGFARKDNETDRELYDKNKNIVFGIMHKFQAKETLVITNPHEYFTEGVGDYLDRVRLNRGYRNSSHIMKEKGYTNWGIAGETIKRLEDGGGVK